MPLLPDWAAAAEDGDDPSLWEAGWDDDGGAQDAFGDALRAALGGGGQEGGGQ